MAKLCSLQYNAYPSSNIRSPKTPQAPMPSNGLTRGLISLCLLSSTLTSLVLVPTVVLCALLHSVAVIIWFARQAIRNKYRPLFILVLVLITLAASSQPHDTKKSTSAPPRLLPLPTLHFAFPNSVIARHNILLLFIIILFLFILFNLFFL